MDTDNELARLLGSFWTAPGTQRALGLSGRDELNQRVADGTVLALTTCDGTNVFPVS